MELFGLVLSDNGIVWFGVVRQWNCLVWCCQTMELFGLAHKGPPCGVLSDNGIVWFGSYNLYNFCCPRVTQLFHHPLSNTTFFSCPKGPRPQGAPLWGRGRGHIIFGNILLS